MPSSKAGSRSLKTVTSFVSMIRGINVGGHRIVKMERLRELYAGLGLLNPRTYLQSGNVVFESGSRSPRALGESIEREILRACGQEVSVAVRSAAAMAAVLAANPLLRRPGAAPAFMHATFLTGGARAALDGVALPLVPGEEAVRVGEVVYVYCPHGYGGTKIHNTFLERRLGCRATTRNWRTVSALCSMARGDPAL